MHINFISTNDTREIRTFYVTSDNSEEIRSGDETHEIITKLIKSFLDNYQEEEKILRNGNNFYLIVLIYWRFIFMKQA